MVSLADLRYESRIGRVLPKRGFTLIELLIVVGIVAILAVIAIPNMLASQVRAKVSRAKNDLRAVASAIEAYYVDANRYPPDIQDGMPEYGGRPGERDLRLLLNRLVPLTTPVAYLSSVPEDQFAGAAIDRHPDYDYGYVLKSSSGGSPVKVRPYGFDYAHRMVPDGRDENVVYDMPLWNSVICRREGAQWAIRSLGPDLSVVYLGHSSATYDPTNGTVSAGQIFYIGPSIGLDAGPVE